MSIKVKWTFAKLQAEALKYKTRVEFQKNSPSAYQMAWRRKILNQICTHMEYTCYPWTNEELEEEALKYKTRREFELGSENAYNAALRRGIMDKICIHMEYFYRSWTNDELTEEALKYRTRKGFCRGNQAAYQIALNRGILDKICSHMKFSRGSSFEERELCSILKEQFPDLIKKNFKIDILGKPYIHRFQVDIFNPETKLGIEYDGPYHHSKEYLIKEKTRLGWSIEDAINYHSIKDNSLLDCHNVKIIHIKDKDWKENKEACVQRCLTFLKTGLYT